MEEAKDPIYPGCTRSVGAPEPAYSNLDLLYLFRWCAHAQRPAGSAHGQNRLLRTLAKRGPMTQRDLASAVQRTPATLSQQLESLEAAGLVGREKCASDRRNVLVSLTPEGRAAVGRIIEEQRRHANDLFGGLEPADRAALGRILSELLERWSGEGATEHALELHDGRAACDRLDCTAAPEAAAQAGEEGAR